MIGNQNLRYFIYCRKSKEKGEAQSLSVRAQYEELTKLAYKENLRIVHCFIENGSALKPGRPIFNEMVKRIKKGEANGILTYEIDRLSKNLKDNAILAKLFGTRLVEIRTLVSNYSLKQSESEKLLMLHWAIANFYSEEVLRRRLRK